MGCDIHAYLEIRRFDFDDKEREKGIWINADKWTKNEFAVLYKEENEPIWHIDYDDRIWGKRWYFLFAVLAGVRNAWDLTPISEKKGLPEDASDEIKQASERWKADGHSHSWLSLKEINEWDGWDIEIKDDFGGETTYRKFLAEFHDKTVKRMMTKVNHNVTEEDVRIVFWFDN